jgi:hypothetical protein
VNVVADVINAAVSEPLKESTPDVCLFNASFVKPRSNRAPDTLRNLGSERLGGGAWRWEKEGTRRPGG